MRKVIAVVKKDLILQTRNIRELMFAVGFTIVVIILFSYTESNDITIGIDSELEDSIGYDKEVGGMTIDFMQSKVIVYGEFQEKEILTKQLKNNAYPLIIYKDDGELTLKMNSKDPQAITTYFLMSRYINGVQVDKFNTEQLMSANHTMLMLVITFAFIFGGASRGSSVLFQEKNDGTLNILYKSGLGSFGIVLSKLIFTMLMMIFILLSVGLFGYLSDTLNLFTSLQNVLLLIFIMLPISIIGNFIGIISRTVEECRTFQIVLFMPSMFYLTIVNQIPTEYQFLLRLHPGIAVTHFYEGILEGTFDILLFTIICVVTFVLFAVNTMILRRFVERAI